MRVVALALLLLASQWPISERSDAEALVEALLFGSYMPSPGHTAGLPPDVQRRLVRYRQRENVFNQSISPPRPNSLDGPSGALSSKQVGLERSVFSLIDQPDSMAVAAAVSSQIQLLSEWEGFASSPLTEAASADAFLASHPTSAVAAYVQLFGGHRRLCALASLEGLDASSPEGRSTTAEAERLLAAARDAGDPILRAVAEHLLTTRTCD